ncbi:hypothetical protein [Streptomyces achromogenes]|uniref:hypothetical protein n=1 Tax=Streptomyces achromogenes TaxID=67255 RepID=UPI0027D82134|nr:hypothetical protein [Streptomyces achromogenes]
MAIAAALLLAGCVDGAESGSGTPAGVFVPTTSHAESRMIISFLAGPLSTDFFGSTGG